MTETRRYHPDFIAIARGLAANGALDRDMATNFGISLTILTEWKAWHPEFAEACVLPREATHSAVEDAFYKHSELNHPHISDVVRDWIATRPADSLARLQATNFLCHPAVMDELLARHEADRGTA